MLIDASYRTLDSPLGPLLIAQTTAGLVRVAFESEGFEQVINELTAAFGTEPTCAPGVLDPVASQLEEYFSGARRRFDVPVDYSLSHGFRQQVQQYLPHIPYGETATYKQVADGVGHPKAFRAVGTACATNPIPIVVPCHRVLRSDGGMGGYRGGIVAKRYLLALEGK